MSARILIGDCLERLAALPAESVHCCITSPPYYGLRDYGTATWEGGDSACDHLGPPKRTQAGFNQRYHDRPAPQTDKQSELATPFRAICGKCGATRQDDQIGLEATPEEHIAKLVEVFRAVRRVLRKDGVLWLNYGDAYAGSWGAQGHRETPAGISRNQINNHPKRASHTDTIRSAGLKPKDLLMMPARVALALQQDGWWLRSMLPWVKRSAMPESVTDRPATAIEYVFLLAKSPRYFFDMEAVRQADTGYFRSRADQYDKYAPPGQSPQSGLHRSTPTGRNFRNSDLFYASLAPPHGLICGAEPLALDVNPAGFAEAHFATFPPKLVEPLIKAGTSERGVCAECGAPWVREVDVGNLVMTSSSADKRAYPSPREDEMDQGVSRSAEHRSKCAYERKTTGWSPSCACIDLDCAATVPATVLDPFGGAGTVALVADRLGRDAVLIELNPDYAAIARKRIDRDAATRGQGPEPVMRGDDLPLFGGAP